MRYLLVVMLLLKLAGDICGGTDSSSVPGGDANGDIVGYPVYDFQGRPSCTTGRLAIYGQAGVPVCLK